MDKIISLEKVSYIYQKGTPFEFCALKDVSINIKRGEMVGIIGPTGSGKSTLIQHFNGLLRPSIGKVYFNGRELGEYKKEKSICFDVGIVFQYPEYQLFEDTIYKDIAFGPINLNLPQDEVENRVKKAMNRVNLDYLKFRDRSPFSLSGGEMRKVALAGVLAMEPKVLVLDEPTAGLDPKGREELFTSIKKLHDTKSMTVIIVSHDMGDIARMVEHVIIINEGSIFADGATSEIFKNYKKIEKIGLDIPPLMELMARLQDKGYNINFNSTSFDGAIIEIGNLLGI